MQNKHQTFFSFFGGPTYGEGGGGPLVGPKAQVFPKKNSDGTPNIVYKIFILQLWFELYIIAWSLVLYNNSAGRLTGILESGYDLDKIFGKMRI